MTKKETNRRWREANKEKIKAYQKKYRVEHRTELYKYHNEVFWPRFYHEVIRRDPKKRMDRNIATAISVALGSEKGWRSWEKLVGYTTEELVEHLEAKFDENMSWDNYGSYWHVDHILPKSSFEYTTPEEENFKSCWALSNLQPLEAKANIIKGSKIL